MNKTININIGGIFFHIDEKAYLKLNHYLEAVRNSLLDDAQGKEEILKDIEQRISELFSVKITKDRQVINEKDVEDVISVMGQPEDYQFEDETTVYKKSEPKKGIRKKLYRDGKDKILGGVASGLANYVRDRCNMDANYFDYSIISRWFKYLDLFNTLDHRSRSKNHHRRT